MGFFFGTPFCHTGGQDNVCNTQVSLLCVVSKLGLVLPSRWPRVARIASQGD